MKLQANPKAPESQPTQQSVHAPEVAKMSDSELASFNARNAPQVAERRKALNTQINATLATQSEIRATERLERLEEEKATRRAREDALEVARRANKRLAKVESWIKRRQGGLTPRFTTTLQLRRQWRECVEALFAKVTDVIHMESSGFHAQHHMLCEEVHEAPYGKDVRELNRLDASADACGRVGRAHSQDSSPHVIWVVYEEGRKTKRSRLHTYLDAGWNKVVANAHREDLAVARELRQTPQA